MDQPEQPGATTATFQVRTPTGSYTLLIHQREKGFYEEACGKYLTEYQFTMANDLRTLERLLLLEVQNFRVQWFLTSGMDYLANPFDAGEETALRRAQKELGAQIIELQRDLGVTKAQRDRDREDSVGAFITNLKVRAKEHGVKREKELGKALELMHELFGVVGAWKRSNQAEREKLELPDADSVLTWIQDYIEVEFKSVDDHFRQSAQRFWIREM